MGADQSLKAMFEEMHQFTMLMMALYGFLLLLMLAGLCFWIWMMVHCVRSKRDNQLIGWMLLLIFLNVPGAIVYFFAGRNPQVQMTDGGSSARQSVDSTCIKCVDPIPGGLTVQFQNGQSKTFHWMDFPKLLSAHKIERDKWELTADRRALVWPELQARVDYAALFPDAAAQF